MRTNMVVISIAVFLFSAVIIALAIYLKPEGRYQFAVSTPPGLIWILDTRNGNVIDLRSSDVTKPHGKPIIISD